MTDDTTNNITGDTRQTLYDTLGEAAFERFIGAFYRRVATDPILSEMYPKEDLDQAERRLRLFVLHMFGGPDTYLQERGPARLRWRHKGFRINQAARDVWVNHMIDALREAEIPEPAFSTLKKYFEAAATAMITVFTPE